MVIFSSLSRAFMLLSSAKFFFFISMLWIVCAGLWLSSFFLLHTFVRMWITFAFDCQSILCKWYYEPPHLKLILSVGYAVETLWYRHLFDVQKSKNDSCCEQAHSLCNPFHIQISMSSFQRMTTLNTTNYYFHSYQLHAECIIYWLSNDTRQQHIFSIYFIAHIQLSTYSIYEI